MSRFVLVGFVGLLIIGGALFLLVNKSAPSPEETVAEVPATDDSDDPDVEFLKRMGVGTDGPSLIRFLEERSPTDIDPDHLEPLLRQLGDPSFEKREKASKKLADIGLAALEALRRATSNRDKEIARRAEELVERQERDLNWGLPLTAVRQLVKQEPPGTLEVLLRFLPFATWDELIEEIWYGIDTLGVTGSRVHPALVASLKDLSPARRALAGCILGREGNVEERTAARKLLEDNSPMVRLRTAQGLLAGNREPPVPALIYLLNDPSVEISWQAEELLHWLAEDGGPEQTIAGGGERNRKECQAAWLKWWSENGQKVEWGKSNQKRRRPGLLLIVEQSDTRASSICLCGCNSKPRWRLENVPNPIQIQLLTGNQILIATDGIDGYAREMGIQAGIIVHDLFGNTLSKRSVFPPLACRILPSGSILSYSHRGLALLMSGGKQDLVYRPEETHSTAALLPQGILLEIDFPNLKEPVVTIREIDVVQRNGIATRQLRVNPKADFFHVSAQPGGSLLVWTHYPDQVLELAATGVQVLRRLPMPGILAASRFRNGDLVVAHRIGSNSRIAEIDQRANIVWEAFSGRYSISQVQPCFRLVRFGFENRLPSNFNLDSVENRIWSLKSKDPLSRCWSATALGILGPKGKRAVPALVDALSDPDSSVRACASVALAEIGKEALPRILIALEGKDVLIRRSALALLGSPPFISKELEPILVNALRDEDPIVRKTALEILGRAQENPDDLLAAIRNGLEDMDRDVRKEALRILREKHSRGITCTSFLVRALNDSDSGIRLTAVHYLEEIAPDAQAAVPSLLNALDGDDKALQVAAACALGKIAPTDKKVVGTLIRLSKDRTSLSARAAGAGGLGNIGPSAREVIPFLIENLTLTDGTDASLTRSLHHNSILALGQMGEHAKDAVPRLVEIIRNKRCDLWLERVPAIEALGKIGPSARAAIPILTNLLEGSDCPPTLRHRLQDAIRRINQG